MAIISGTTVDWTISPRVITIPVAETSVTIEDLQDTLQDLEDSEEGIVWPFLRETSGGEALGGGVSVGWTMELQNAQIAFAARTTPLENGTVTTGGTTTMIDSAATFQTNNVGRGDLIINVTDSSQCTVVSVDSEIQLTTTALTGGTSNDFVISDAYDVYDVVQCSILGGNLVAVDAVEAELDPIFPTFGTQIIRTSASSATTQNQASLNHSSFNGGVTIDSTSSYTGTTFPVGTGLQPVNNLADAKTIASNNGFNILFVVGSFTYGATDNVDGYILVGEGPPLSEFTFITGASTIKTIIKNCHVIGDTTGAVDITDCHVEGLVDVGGTTIGTNFNTCVFEADSGDALGLSPTSTEHIHMVSCSSGSEGDTPASFDCNGSSADMTIRYWGGGIKFRNMTNAAQQVSIDSVGGDLVIDSTCTAGTIVILGSTRITDNSSGAVTVIDKTTATLTNSYLERSVWVDTEGTAGDGSQGSPFNNLTTAIDFAETEGIKTLYVYADITLDRQLKNFKIIGVGTPTIDCNGQNLNKSEFWHCRMEGTYTGTIIVQESVLLNNFNLNGFFEKCGIAGDLTCVNGGSAFVKNCSTSIQNTAINISMNSGGISQLSVSGFSGHLTIKDCDNVADTVEVGMSEGELIFDSSNTLGTLHASGSANFIDSTAGATVIDQTTPAIVWGHVIDGTFTAAEVQRLIASAAAAKLSGADTLEITLRDLADTKDRMVLPVDENGNRIGPIVYDVSK